MRPANLLLYFSIIVLLSSCTQRRYIYAAAKNNTPSLQKKGDSRLNASFSFGKARGTGDSSVNYGYDIQGAYALTNHFALMASYYSRRESDVMDEGYRRAVLITSSFVNYRRHLLEAGAGYFDSIDKNAVFNVYAGAAFGKLSLDDVGLMDSIRYARFFNANVRKYFIQPGVSFFNRSQGSFNLNLRLSLLQFNTTSTGYSDRELDYFNLKGTGSRLHAFFMEPSFNFQLPFFSTNWLKLEGSLNLVINQSAHRIRPLNLSLGFTVDPAKAFRKNDR